MANLIRYPQSADFRILTTTLKIVSILVVKQNQHFAMLCRIISDESNSTRQNNVLDLALGPSARRHYTVDMYITQGLTNIWLIGVIHFHQPREI